MAGERDGKVRDPFFFSQTRVLSDILQWWLWAILVTTPDGFSCFFLSFIYKHAASNTIATMFRRYFASAVKQTPKVDVSDIVIIGGGPAGLSLANGIKSSLVLKDLKCTLIEGGKLVENLESYYENPPQYIDKRVVSITPSSIEYFQKIGCWNYVKDERIETYDHIHTYDGVTGAKMEFESDGLATMIENINIQSMLYQRIKELNAENPASKLQLLDNTKVVNIEEDAGNKWPILKLSNGDSIKTRLLIGCDGFNSPVRKYAQIESRGWSYNRWGNVATCKYKDTEFRYPTGWQRFLPTGTLALLPLPNNWCSLVWAVPPEISDILGKLTDEQFAMMVNAGAKLSPEQLDFLYKTAATDPDALLEEIQWRLAHFKGNSADFPLDIELVVAGSRAKFPLKLSHADCYVDERVALVGDAAHTTHPLAGQGLNMGQADVQALVGVLESAHRRGLDIGVKLALEPYWAERYGANHVMLGVVDKIHKIHAVSGGPLVWARSLGVNVLNALGPVKQAMVDAISHYGK